MRILGILLYILLIGCLVGFRLLSKSREARAPASASTTTRPPWITDTIAVAAVTAALYVGAYVREVSFMDALGAPDDFAVITPGSFVGPLGAWATLFASCATIWWMTVDSNNEHMKRMRAIVLIVLIAGAVVVGIPVRAYFKGWLPSCLFVGSFAVMCLYIAWRRLRFPAEYLPPLIPTVLVSCFASIALACADGFTDARERTKYLCRSGQVVLSSHDGRLIVASLHENSSRLTGEFTFIDAVTAGPLIYRSIGPLCPSDQASPRVGSR